MELTDQEMTALDIIANYNFINAFKDKSIKLIPDKTFIYIIALDIGKLK